MTEQSDLIDLTAGIVSAFVGNNAVRAAELPDLIRTVHDSLSGIIAPKPVEGSAAPTPAVPIKKSVTDDYIISLEDGRKFKSMKRYLSGLGMTPDEYRTKWGLPRDYPMVAPGYAAKRSELAKAAGLGNGRRTVEAAPDLLDTTALTPVPEAAPAVAPAAQEPAPQASAEVPVKRRGRPKKAA